ncbi:hypothetical protein [Kitasatospora sp. NPDC004272]
MNTHDIAEPTWPNIITRCTTHLLTITNRGTRPDADTGSEPLTPGQFTDLLGQAVETLESLPGTGFRGAADVLHVAHTYLSDALNTTGAENTLLRLGFQHLSDLEDIARDVRHG